MNTDQSKVTHFRKSQTMRSDFTFKIGENILETIKNTNIETDSCTKSGTCEILSKSAVRALESVISKIHHLKQCGFEPFIKLYVTCFVPVSDYFAPIWPMRFPNSRFQWTKRSILDLLETGTPKSNKLELKESF